MQCFVDMDGVLVDFVSGACRALGVKNPYEESSDHDGVYSLAKVLKMRDKDFYAPMNEGFWADLEPTAECFELMEMLELAFGENLCVLTKPTANPGCMEGKRRWLKKHLPHLRRRWFMGHSKWLVAHPQAVLVDDSPKNISMFAGAGGHTILVPQPWNCRAPRPDPLEYVESEIRCLDRKVGGL